MAFINKIKTMFGFDSDYEQQINEEDSVRDATVTPLSERRKAEVDSTSATASSATDNLPEVELPEVPTVVPDAIFAKVVDIFNESMPQFFRETVDREAQQRYIYDALDQSMKDYIASLAEVTEKRISQQYANDRTRLNREMEDIRERSRRIEDTNAEWREQKLSAERQKRALSERVHDLEKQVDTLQASNEQYDLENKSLVNKLRVMSTIEADAEAMRNNADELRAEVNRLKAQLIAAANGASAEEGSEDAIAALKAHDEELAAKHQAEVDELVAKHQVEIAEITAKHQEEVAKITTKHQEEVDNFLKRCEIADGMINDLNHKLNETRNELSAHDELLEQSQSSLEEFASAISQFETVKANLDNRISQLQSTLKQREDEIESQNKQIEQFTEEIESLKSTIETNIRRQAESEEQLHNEIERLRSAEPERRRGRKSTKVEDLDDNLDDTNWLVGTPPEGTNARPFGVSDEEFGYQEPKRRPSNDDPAQMSLW